MRYLIILIVAIWSLTVVVARAQDAGTPDDASAIESVISGQLDAFSDRDVDAAWDFASPFIQGIFGDARTFGTMVERGYPMVWDNSDVRFLGLRNENGRPMQKVMIRDAGGDVHFLEYEMIETPDGWQINGVALVEADLAA